MKAICIADLHGDVGASIKLRNSIMGGGFEYVFILGDFSKGFKDPEENKRDITSVLDAFKGFNVKAIPGNCDQKSAVQTFKDRGVNFHNTILNLPEASIIGLGGSNATPFNTPFEYSEAEIADTLRNIHSYAEEGKRLILITHAPPKDTKCDVVAGQVHVGSSAIREFVEAAKPELVLCSHIHECGGAEDMIGATRVLNIGRLSEGRAYSLEVGDEILIEQYLG